ncbi:MAG: class I SAM-dependent methyltransferase [Deltaproteobacteria bacterium]
MNVRDGPMNRTYNSVYDQFDSPLMRRVRGEAYGEDIGQHSWVTARELRGDIDRLGLAPSHHLLDVGCGPCGPLTYVLRSVGCRGTGLDLSSEAVALGRHRAASLGLDRLATIMEADLNLPLPLESGSLDAAMSLDVVLHVRDRTALFREIARVLVPGGRFLFTDAGVLTGVISDDEVAARSLHGHTRFVAPGFNERALDDAGFRLLETEDRTESLLMNAEGRLSARLAHREELEQVEGATDFAREQEYLDTVIALSRRRFVSRMMYLAQVE